VEHFRVDRALPVGVHPLTRLATGLEHARGLVLLYPDARQRQAFLDGVEVFVSAFHGYMWIDDVKGRVVVSAEYLRSGEERGIFLDLVHELVHIRQHHEGQDLWDERFAYVDRPTEVEAYRVAVAEARELGLTEEEICEYLHVPWTSDKEHERLCSAMGVAYFPRKR
jgi:hypothetical protein